MATATVPTRLEAARSYLARGFQPLPIPPKSKAPVLSGWTGLRFTPNQLQAHFRGGGNIGVLLGDPSHGLVDVDLDCSEARDLAPKFLPETPAKTGRPSAPASHWWYLAPGLPTAQKHDPVTNEMIVELRSTGGQTVVGPSVHPSGERYDMLDADPAEVAPDVLAQAVEDLYRAVLRKRYPEGPPVKPQPGCEPKAVPAPASSSGSEIEVRAAAYVDAMPAAISGQRGHSATYAAATALVHGFGLSEDCAFQLLLSRYNPRCEPAWSEKELRHKVNQAAAKTHRMPHGWLRDAEEASDVDLSHFDPWASNAKASMETPPPPDRPSDPGPFPRQLLDVPGFIRQVVDYNLGTAVRPQPVRALAGAVCLQAVLAGRKVRDERGNRTNLYLVGVAPSGAGKDHARKVNKNILFHAGLPELEGNEDLASDAGLIAAVEQHPASLFQIDEFGRFLRTIGDPKRAPHLFNVLSAMMKLYSSADTVFRGKAYADRKQNRIIDQPCACLYGTSVPEHFFESLTIESVNDGFVARLLVFEAETTPPRQRPSLADIPAHIVEAARGWGEFRPGGNLASEHPQPLVVPCTPEAGSRFDRLADRVDRELASTSFEGRAIWARAEEKACRLGLTYACSANRECPVIDMPAAEWACSLVEYLTERVLFVASEWIAEGQFDARQKRVVRMMRAAGGILSRSDFCRRTQWLTQRERHDIIENLKETGRMVQRVQGTATKQRVEYALVH